MQIFIILNLTIAVLLAAVMIAFQKDENGLLLLFGMVLLPSFYALAIGNIVAVFHFWKRHRFRAFFQQGGGAVRLTRGTPIAEPIVAPEFGAPHRRRSAEGR
jgi:hypothetical protein